MQSENKTCQNCQKSFTIESEDFNFYEKIKVPPPTFCPDCRLVRRLNWRNERNLFKRACDKTGKPVITMFHPEAEVRVYEHDVWWSDEWDPCEYGQNYDFSKPFFEQFQELLLRVPLTNLGNTNCPGSPYGNHNVDCENCYLTFASYMNQNIYYSQGAANSRDCFDSYTIQKCEQCYEDTLCKTLYQTHFSYNSDDSVDSYFLQNCINCQDCIGCVNLRHKRFCIFNKQLAEEEFKKQKKEFNFGSYEKLSDFKNKYRDFALKFPQKYSNIIKSVDVSGDNIMNAKNVKYSFDIYGDMENCKFVAHGLGAKDSYDCYGFGGGASLLYEGVDTGLKAFNQYFSVLTHSCLDTAYTYMCYNSKNLFGCIGLRKKEYCILNRQYAKAEYETMLPKIIEHMNKMPFTDKKGIVYRYGEFFPAELSPFSYNESIANEYFPKNAEEIKKDYFFREGIEREYKTTLDFSNMPEDITDVKDDIVNEIAPCRNKDLDLFYCTQAFRILKEELNFLRKQNIALPRLCPNCRHYERLERRNQMKLWRRSCMCDKANHNHSGRCQSEFETPYSPDRPEIIYCEKCYQQEVY